MERETRPRRKFAGGIEAKVVDPRDIDTKIVADDDPADDGEDGEGGEETEE
jgi:hypothetical protein